MRRQVNGIAVLEHARMFSVSSRLCERQHNEKYIRTHHLGLTETRNVLGDEYKRAAPAAEWMNTPVHEGLGTSAADPFVRTVSNLPFQAPQSTVLESAITKTLTLDQRDKLGSERLRLNEWFSGTDPKIKTFFESMELAELPIPPNAVELLSRFRTETLPRIPAEANVEDSKQMIEIKWDAMCQGISRISPSYMDPKRFTEDLEAQLSSVADMMGDGKRLPQDVISALELHRRLAIAKRNKALRETVTATLLKNNYLRDGDAIWSAFFDFVAKHENVVLDTESIKTRWNCVTGAEPPAVRPAVALLWAIHTMRATDEDAPDDMKDQGRRVMDDPLKESAKRIEGFFERCTAIEKRDFVISELRKHFTNGVPKAFAQAILDVGMNDVFGMLNELRSSDGVIHEQNLKNAKEVLPFFKDSLEAQRLTTKLLSDGKEFRPVVRAIVGVSSPEELKQAWESGSLKWSQNYEVFAEKLLTHNIGLLQVIRLCAKGEVSNITKDKSRSRESLFGDDAVNAIAVLEQTWERAIQKAHKQKIECMNALTKFENISKVLRALIASGSDTAPLARIENEKLKQVSIIGDLSSDLNDLFREAISTVYTQYPNWVKVGVLPPKAEMAHMTAGNTRMLMTLVKIYCRLTYIPHVGDAVLKSRYRRRIGPIGTETTQQNIPVEIGFTDYFDNTTYKRHDWQGWYQRMRDVQNRNVSIKLPVSSLYRLNSSGIPFFDMQSERRMRVLAAERVGVGVLKLDSDKFEDQKDNLEYGTSKFNQLLSEAKKAQISKEYWPSVEVKVKKPSGQSRMRYSLIDDERIEKRSKELYEMYKEKKKSTLFVTPMDLWLKVSGTQSRTGAARDDSDGYTHNLFDNDASKESS